jgi:hypothetical protein
MKKDTTIIFKILIFTFFIPQIYPLLYDGTIEFQQNFNVFWSNQNHNSKLIK